MAFQFYSTKVAAAPQEIWIIPKAPKHGGGGAVSTKSDSGKGLIIGIFCHQVLLPRAHYSSFRNYQQNKLRASSSNNG